MVINTKEKSPATHNEHTYEPDAHNALEAIATKSEVQKKGNDYYIEGTQGIKDRRLLLAETLQLAAEISEALESVLPESTVLQENWEQFAAALQVDNLTRKRAKQTENSDKLDVADYIESVDAATLILQLNDPEKIKDIDIATYTRMSKALNVHAINSIKALFMAVENSPEQQNKEIYEIGLGIEDLVAREIAIDMLSGYAEDQKDRKYEELTSETRQPIVDLEPYFTGKDKNPNPWALR